MISGYLISTSFPWVDDWSTDPRVLGCHRYHIFIYKYFYMKCVLTNGFKMVRIFGSGSPSGRARGRGDTA